MYRSFFMFFNPKCQFILIKTKKNYLFVKKIYIFLFPNRKFLLLIYSLSLLNEYIQILLLSL